MDEANQQLETGHVEVSSAPPTGYDGVSAVLWLPDPEQRHGWREYYVLAPSQKPGGKVGF